MKKTKIILALITTLSCSQAATLKVTCEAPDLHYVYRFNLEQTLNVYQDENDSYSLYVNKLKLEATKAGFDATKEELELKGLRGTLKKIEGQFTKDPYYNLKLQSQDKKVLVNLNLDYPSKLSSFVRTAEGFQFKSTCKVEEFKSCLFGDTLFNTLENESVIKEELGDELKVIPGFADDNSAVNTEKVKLTYANGKQYMAWYTYQDEVDGGNTYGTIEDLAGNQLAAIGDSDIYDCKEEVSLK